MLMLNRKLSEDRGNAVLNWLADNGVDRTRLTAKRYGSARLWLVMKPILDARKSDESKSHGCKGRVV
jgi:hypothetical protein